MGKVLQFPNKRQYTEEYRCQWVDAQADQTWSEFRDRVSRIKRSIEKINEIMTEHRKKKIANLTQTVSGCVVCGGTPCRCPD